MIKKPILNYGATSSILSLMVVLPPRSLAIYLALVFFLSIIYLFMCQGIIRQISLTTWLAVLALFGAAFFSVLGTLPVSTNSDIQLEFFKYTIYAFGFISGYIFLSHPQHSTAHALFVFLLILVFFIIASFKSPERLFIDQSQFLYPPDQNNSVSILFIFVAPFLFLSYHPILNVIGLFVFFLFIILVESRIGFIFVCIYLAWLLLKQPRAGLITFLLGALIWMVIESQGIVPQTLIINTIQSVGETLTGSEQSASELNEALIPRAAEHAHSIADDAQGSPELSTEQAPIDAARYIIAFGTGSDMIRLRILEQSMTVAWQVFPNWIGLGESETISMINAQPIHRDTVFTHAHNFLLQSYLAFGLLATTFMIAFVSFLLFWALKLRTTVLTVVLLSLIAFAQIESLISDVRVLAVTAVAIGGLCRRLDSEIWKSN